MKVKSEDILKPGAKLIVEKIDWTKSPYKEALADTRRRQKALRNQMKYTQEHHDAMSRIITI